MKAFIQKRYSTILKTVPAENSRRKMMLNFPSSHFFRKRFILVALFLSITFSSPIFAADYYIDAGAGTNTATCGDQAFPCRTILYVLNNFAGSGDDIYLVGATAFQVRGLTINMELSFHGIDAATTVLDAGGNGERHFLINAPGAATVVFEDLSFTEGDVVGNNGGALVVDDGVLLLRRVAFSDNSAQNGGALVVNAGAVLSQDVTFSSNSAVGNGGAIFVTDGVLDVRRTTFNYNSADYGGAVSLDGESIIVFEDAIFEHNAAGTHGGAIYTLATTTIRRSDFQWNTAGDEGGAIRAAVYDGGLDIRRSQFTENEGNFGGGLYIGDGEVDIRRCSFVRNVAIGTGGAISADWVGPQPDEFNVVNTTFSANNASSGGGISAQTGTLTFVTMVDNSGTYIDHDLQGQFEIYRSIITHPNLGSGGNECNGPQSGASNLIDSSSCDPLIASTPAFNLGAHNNSALLPLGYYGGRTLSYGLMSTSVAVNAANNCMGANGVVGVDQRGEDRPSALNPACDIGAFERQL